MSLEEDPKEVARKERKTVEADRLMKQFCNMESSVDPSKYKAGHDKAFRNLCLDCDGFGTIGISGKYARTEEKCASCDGTGKKVL